MSEATGLYMKDFVRSCVKNAVTVCNIRADGGDMPRCSMAYRSRDQGSKGQVFPVSFNPLHRVFILQSWGLNKVAVSRKFFQSLWRFQALKHNVMTLLVTKQKAFSSHVKIVRHSCN